jgi:protein-S-isoprenylcysteine O-methyltransferase Ste14
MRPVYLYTIPVLWSVFAMYWVAARRHAKTTLRRESLWSSATHMVPLAIAFLLIALPRFPGLLGTRLVLWTPANFWVGAPMVAAGLGFAIWARIYLGRNWSLSVTVKEGHHLVRRGPYAWVRHPIYTGLLLAFIGSAISLDEWRGFLAVVIAGGALWSKLRIEERWMLETFGDDYKRYQSEVPALIPFLL